MGMDLAGKQGDRSYNRRTWAYLIELALQYGWKPAGAKVWEGYSIPDREQESSDSPPAEAEETPRDNHPLKQQVDQVVAKELSVMSRNRQCDLGSYFTNEGNLVLAEDARALGDALERALSDVPDHDAMEHKTVPDEQMPGRRRLQPGVEICPIEWFSGPGKEHLKDFIWFCRQGEFDIS